jgi:hypothetical protein
VVTETTNIGARQVSVENVRYLCVFFVFIVSASTEGSFTIRTGSDQFDRALFSMITRKNMSRLLFAAQRRNKSSLSIARDVPVLTFLKDGIVTPNEQNNEYNTIVGVSVFFG